MRTILHSDLNNCFASIEALDHPEYKKVPFAVGGDRERRHGIILAKNDIAKKFGIKTGEPIVAALKKCPDLKLVQPHYEKYDLYCTAVRELYCRYTDLVEPFGIDESWLDTTGSQSLFGSGETIARELRQRIKKEFGLTVSVGVSFNKIFAKLGSDYKKPDAVTVISCDNFKNIVWPLPVESLLYVGNATKARLNRVGITTVGELAEASPTFLKAYMGKAGESLYRNANGLDSAPVQHFCHKDAIKSIGNSTTTPRDMENIGDVRVIFTLLAEQVCSRLRRHGLKCGVVQISFRDNRLMTFERQMTLKSPTDISSEVYAAAMKLLIENYSFSIPLRSVGIRGANLTSALSPEQLSFFCDPQRTRRLSTLERVKDEIREKYGRNAICRAVMLSDESLLPIYNHAEVSTIGFKSH